MLRNDCKAAVSPCDCDSLKWSEGGDLLHLHGSPWPFSVPLESNPGMFVMHFLAYLHRDFSAGFPAFWKKRAVSYLCGVFLGFRIFFLRKIYTEVEVYILGKAVYWCSKSNLKITFFQFSHEGNKFKALTHSLEAKLYILFSFCLHVPPYFLDFIYHFSPHLSPLSYSLLGFLSLVRKKEKTMLPIILVIPEDCRKQVVNMTWC